jgi:excisionase family DNA binding protein
VATHQSLVNQPKIREALLDAADASELLKLHPRTVKRLALTGDLPAMRIGRVWRFRPSDIDRWIVAQIDSNSHPRLESEKTR